MVLFKPFNILFLFFAICSIAMAQIRSDFQISESGCYPYFDLDNHSRIHIIWEKQLESDHGTYYSVLDSTGNTIYDARRISYSIATRTPRLAINNDLVACIWEDYLFLTVSFYKTYIITKIIKDGQNYSEELHVDDGDIVQTDAYRGWPAIFWQNDSTLFAIWQGQGMKTDPLKGLSDIYMKKLLLPLPLHRAFVLDTVLNDTEIKVDESFPAVIKKITESGYLTVWLEQDSSDSWKIAGVACDDSLRPVSDKIVFVSFGALPTNFMAPPFTLHKNNGNILIGWEKDTTNSYANIYFQEFTEQGIAVSGINKVNDTLAYGTNRVSADIDSDGNFIIEWDSYGADFFAQRYAADMVKIGSNLRVNTLQTGYNLYPYVKLKNKRIYTIWRKSISGSKSVWMNILDFNNPSALGHKENPTPMNFHLYPVYPNPFNANTTISFDLPEKTCAEILIFDQVGREIWRSNKSDYSAGKYSVNWNGTNHSGQPVGTGMYLVRLNSNKYTATQKVLLMK